MPTTAADIRVCFVGDSFVNGTGDDTCLGWAGRLCATLRQVGYDVTSYNLGVRRETSADIAARWLAEVLPRLPASAVGRVVFSFGVNDTALEHNHLRVPLAASIANLERVLRAASARFETLMIGPPPIADDAQDQRIAELSLAFAATCQAIGIPYLDVFTPLCASTTWRAEVAAGDGAHPNAGGYSEWAQLVAGWNAWQRWWPTPMGVATR